MKNIDFDEKVEKLLKLVEMEELKDFIDLRKEYVEESMKEEKEQIEKYNQIQKWIDMMEDQCTEEELSHSDTYQATIYQMNNKKEPIEENVLNDLKNAGYDIELKGTKLIADLITMFYHERKLFGLMNNNIYYNRFWNLDNNDNVHYKMLGLDSEEAILQMQESIDNNSISNIVYNIADKYINNDSNEISYTKTFTMKDLRRK